MIRTQEEIAIMRAGGKILAEILDIILARAIVGESPKALDALARKEAEARHAKPAFLGFHGHPASLCVSRNNQVVHGIPDSKPLQDGDLVSFDFGILFQGMYTDAARSVLIGSPDQTKQRLIDVCRDSFYAGLKKVRAGSRVGDIGYAVQSYVERHGYSVVRALVGHGVGKSLHEDPRVPNFGSAGSGPALFAGMTIAVEPMITAGKFEVVTEEDGWTVSTADKSLAAHYENTIVITERGYEIITE
jgi:methionyl aminopeptidase